jgi:DNA-binding MarR family transcriptional regulator
MHNLSDNTAITDAPDRYPKEQMIDLVRGILLLQNKMKSDRFETWSDKFAGMTKMDLHILLLVQTYPDIVLGEIRERLGVPNSTLTGVVDRMERHGLVGRTMSMRDRRSYGLKLTGKGKAVRREHDRILTMIADRMLATLNEGERVTFIKLLSKVADNVQL